MKQGYALAVLLATIAAGLAAHATAQQTPPVARPVTEAVRVNVVNVEVSVTGKDGKPLFDLNPEEFELREDGKIVPLTNFLAPTPHQEEASMQAPLTAAAAPRPRQPSEEESQRTLIVFVDNLNLTHPTRLLVLDHLESFLVQQLRSGYREVLLIYDRSLHQLTPLTTDPSVAAAALRSMRTGASEGTIVQAQRDRTLADMSRGAALDAGPRGDVARQGILWQMEMLAEEQTYLQRGLLDALLGLVDSLSGMPGRKALLYVSNGIPVGPGDVTQNMFLFREVVKHANAGRITFYTIYVATPGGNVPSAEYSVPSPANVDSIGGEWSLTELTVATGGQKLYNADMLQRMTTDLEASYSLGYAPDHFGDGTYHRLSVTVTRAGVSVRCREGYLDKTPEQRQADRTTAALLAGGNANPLDARVELGTPHRQARKRVAVPLTVAIPAANLVLLEAGEFHEGKVSITIAASKYDGSTSEVHRETFPIKVPSRSMAGFLKHDTTFAFTLVFEPGDRSVSVTAHDDVAQVESVVVSPLAAAPRNN